MRRVKISAISYLNTSPFVYGLRHSEISKHIDITFDTPAACAAKLLSKDADMGIVPVAVVPQIHDCKIVSDYCIGADGPVRSVVICSSVPIEKIQKLYLDNESRTSVLLARIMLNENRRLSPEIVPLSRESDVNPQESGSAYVLIGDKVFRHENKFPYIYDLAQEWKDFSGLPFVFAVWTAVTPLSPDFLAEFNNALALGINNISAAVEEHKPEISRAEAVKYLSENIDYNFDPPKRKAMMMFWNLSSKYRS